MKVYRWTTEGGRQKLAIAHMTLCDIVSAVVIAEKAISMSN